MIASRWVHGLFMAAAGIVLAAGCAASTCPCPYADTCGGQAALRPCEQAEDFVPLFDGKTLKGWHYDPALWKVKDGIIVGNSHVKKLEKNSCAITEQSFGDFILRFDVKWISGNSGVQFRSQALPDFEVAGYQADVVPLGWGNLHEQNGRGRLVDGWTGKAEKAADVKGWNAMEVEARGPHIILRTNGVVTADWTETDPAGAKSGVIALQLHRGDPMEVEFRNIRIKPLDTAGTCK